MAITELPLMLFQKTLSPFPICPIPLVYFTPCYARYYIYFFPLPPPPQTESSEITKILSLPLRLLRPPPLRPSPAPHLSNTKSPSLLLDLYLPPTPHRLSVQTSFPPNLSVNQIQSLSAGRQAECSQQNAITPAKQPDGENSSDQTQTPFPLALRPPLLPINRLFKTIAVIGQKVPRVCSSN